ncbi:MAG: hypothetical protein A2X37_09385 [Elusimicrobia bacterium GWA2_66_18]|nr:MAG: hypothetical protein A2X37_09385 [Elusimicrobia bacterium GWA2_66_18]
MSSLGRDSGQIVVEMLLILPVFLSMVFLIMETGNISFRLIVLNHATYEVARIGGMTWSIPSLGNEGKMNDVMKRILPAASVRCYKEETIYDPQAYQMNYDLVCVAQEPVQLIFPMSRVILAKPSGAGSRTLTAVVRMPIESPLKQ